MQRFANFQPGFQYERGYILERPAARRKIDFLSLARNETLHPLAGETTVQGRTSTVRATEEFALAGSLNYDVETMVRYILSYSMYGYRCCSWRFCCAGELMAGGCRPTDAA